LTGSATERSAIKTVFTLTGIDAYRAAYSMQLGISSQKFGIRDGLTYYNNKPMLSSHESKFLSNIKKTGDI
jgi:hypothetical protein